MIFEAEHVLENVLILRQFEAECSCKRCSYKKKECTTFRPRRDYIFFYIRMVANLEGMNYNVVSLHHDVANEVI